MHGVPIFYLHHAYVDRLYRQWQANITAAYSLTDMAGQTRSSALEGVLYIQCEIGLFSVYVWGYRRRYYSGCDEGSGWVSSLEVWLLRRWMALDGGQ